LHDDKNKNNIKSLGSVYFQAQFVQDWINKEEMEPGCPPVPELLEKMDIERLLEDQTNSGYFEIILWGFSETLPLIMVQDQGFIEDGKRVNGPYSLDINLTTNLIHGNKIKNPKWRNGEIYRYAMKRDCILERNDLFTNIHINLCDESEDKMMTLSIPIKECLEKPENWMINGLYDLDKGEKVSIVNQDSTKIYLQMRWVKHGRSVPYDPPEYVISHEEVWPPRKI